MQLLAILALVLGIIISVVYVYSQRNVYNVAITPGESILLAIEVPMQRFGRSKSFAKEQGLPIRCIITRLNEATSDFDGVSVIVVHAEHTVHKMRAKVHVSATKHALKGKRKWRAEFELDGEGDWPTATIVVNILD